MMERMAEGAIELNDNEVFHNCSYSCYANLADALNMLRGYEDTGLTPEKIKSLQGVYAVFMKAMAEGRLMELPCKVGDSIYRLNKSTGRVHEGKVGKIHVILDGDIEINIWVQWGAMYEFLSADEIGKTVFLTREEAERTLREQTID